MKSEQHESHRINFLNANIYMYKLLICKKKTGRKNGSGRQSEQKKER